MHRFSSCRWLVAAAALFAGAVLAQPASPASAPAQAPTWRSAFEGYRPYAEVPVAPWRESNDTVGRNGGWRVYAREAQQPETAAPSVPAAPAASAPRPAAPAAGGHSH